MIFQRFISQCYLLKNRSTKISSSYYNKEYSIILPGTLICVPLRRKVARTRLLHFPINIKPQFTKSRFNTISQTIKNQETFIITGLLLQKTE